MTSEIARRRQVIARRRKKLPPAPQGHPDGTWLPDHERKTEVFVHFEDLHFMCRDVMKPENSHFVEQDLGKMDYKDDPTYNLRRKK
jgi:hypothetical protein